jgi:hypothetical protein
VISEGTAHVSGISNPPQVKSSGLSIVVAAQLTPLEIVGQRVHAAESFEQVRNLLSSGYILYSQLHLLQNRLVLR